jgi:ribonuclease HI
MLDSIAEAWAEKLNTKKEIMVKTLKLRESQRSTARKIKWIRNKLSHGGTTVVTVQNNDGSSHDITEKHAMEAAIMEANEAKFQQSFHTPFMQPPLVNELGYQGLGPASKQILSGEYIPHTNINSFTTEYIRQLQTPLLIGSEDFHTTTIPLETYCKYWKKANTKTSSYPSEISFATLKASAQDKMTAEFDCIMTRIPLQTGYAPKRWRECTDVMILKRAGLTNIDSLRTIVLFQADCNYAYKFCGREMMHNAEKHLAVAKEQYGSRKRHRAIDHALNKVLSHDLLRQLKQPGAICSNDAKSCYDLIGHTPASLSMQRLGMPPSFVKCLLETLQNMKHKVRTAFGDSDLYYGGPFQPIPMHGICQGNGAGPAIWVAVSTPLLNMLRSAGVGCTFHRPITGEVVHFVGYAFVDDTDLIQSNLNQQEIEQVISDMQKSLNTWEGGLHATGGAIVPGKSFWTLAAFHWSGGNWRYLKNNEAPGTITVKDIAGLTQNLARLEPHMAAETLGVFIAADGNWDKQVESLIAKSAKWADQIRTGHLSHQEVWIALGSTIWKTLTYPCDATALTEQECNRIMRPALMQALQSMGICRNFPRSLVFAPTSHLGLGISNIHTVQEIRRLKNIISHTANASMTGDLFRSSLEALILEVGIGEDVLSYPWLELSFLATKCLIKASWKFLDKHNLTLSHDITINPLRINDKPLMKIFYDAGVRGSDLLAINKCRLYLKIFFLSDMATGDGISILQDALNGTPYETANQFSWPCQGKPSNRDWSIWRANCSTHLLIRHSRLKYPLGSWTDKPTNKSWLYDPNGNRLYKPNGQLWQYFTYVPSKTRRLAFEYSGETNDLPPSVLRATVHKQRTKYVCTGFGPQATTPSCQHGSLQETIQALPEQIKWSILNHQASDEGEHIAAALINNTAIAVSDGSFKDNKGTSGWIVEGDTQAGRIIGWNMVPGFLDDHSSYRSELTGILAILTLIKELCTIHDITTGGLTIGCDSESAVEKITDGTIELFKDADFDLVFTILNSLKSLPVKVQFRHIKGHQDKHKQEDELDRWEILNIEADKLAKQAMNYFASMPPHFAILNEPWAVWANGTKLVKNFQEKLYQTVHVPTAEHYWIYKGKVNPTQLSNINWTAIQKAMKTAPFNRRKFIVKHTSGMCGVGKFTKIWKETETDNCPRCGDYEDATHVWVCQNNDATLQWNKSLADLHKWMMTVKTDPDIAMAIIEHLDCWRNDIPTINRYPNYIEQVLQAQLHIGWQQFLEGFTHKNWVEIQTTYYRSIKCMRSSKKWISQLLLKLWGVAWDLWEHRNQVLHQHNSSSSPAEVQALNTRISTLYTSLVGQHLPQDQYLFHDPLDRILKKTNSGKKEWIHQATAAMRMKRQQVYASRASERTVHRMRACLATWLSEANT